MTVKRATISDGPPEYERAIGPTGFNPFEAQVVALLRDHLPMPGWIANLRRQVLLLRPLLALVEPADR